MKKWLVLILVGMFLSSGVGAVATNVNDTQSPSLGAVQETVGIAVSTLQVSTYDDSYVSIRLGDPELYVLNAGQPMMPRVLKQYELPFGATNIQVQVEPLEVQSQHLSGILRPSPSPVPYSSISSHVVRVEKDPRVYGCDALYPEAWYGTQVGVGLNAKGEHVTFLSVNLFPARWRPLSGELQVASEFTITVHYDEPLSSPFPQVSTYDLVIITPKKFTSILERLVAHKNTMGVPTVVKTTEEIYDEYAGVDKPEDIKLFIKDAMETWGVKYVLLFGGLKSILWGKAKDDVNQGSKGWWVPVRYSNFQYDADPSYNFTSDEPGYISDLYYADVYKDGGVFDNWDSNGNGIFAEWSGDLVRDELDLYPDIAFGRLACRNSLEANHVVDKIINYETTTAGADWFNRIMVASGDGFIDQRDWNIQWDTTGLPNGEYTIYGQSSNPEGVLGPVDEIHITIDKTVATNLTFNHDDHLNPALAEGYPAPPITEIVSVSNNNTLGNTDFQYTPNDGEAYCNDLYWWANISYLNGVLIIRGKSYDPEAYGNLTNLSVWVKNEADATVFSDTRTNMQTYYEGEWVVGEKTLYGRGGALTFVPDFEDNQVFTSNGVWYDQSDIIEEFSKGYGLAYFSGHGSPGWWGDHYPGVPGNRRYGQVAGLVVTQAKIFFPYFTRPVLPMRKLTNANMLPVLCVGGCHNSFMGVSLIPSVLNLFLPNYMFTYGVPTPECWGWYMVKMPHTGAIATTGNTGYGWGSEGDVCMIGTGDGWLNTEFFRQYGEQNQTMLGMTYTQALTSYITNFKTFEWTYWRIDSGWDGIDQKTVQQWELLGDPSLKIGGYE